MILRFGESENHKILQGSFNFSNLQILKHFLGANSSLNMKILNFLVFKNWIFYRGIFYLTKF